MQGTQARRGALLLAVFSTGVVIGLALVAGCAPAPSTAPVPTAAAEVEHEKKAEPPAPPAAAGTGKPNPVKMRLELAIDQIRQREIQTTNAFWTVFHGILGCGPGLALRDPVSREQVNALDYIFSGDFRFGEIRGMRFIPTKDGLDVQTGPTFVGQGHTDQFIAEIAQWDVPIDRRVVVYGKEYTLRDFLAEMMARVRMDQELSWTILAVGHYYGTNLEWTNRAGDKIRFEDLVRAEVDASVDQAPCGGTHRLFGLTWVYHIHKRNGGKDEGVWLDLVNRLEDHKQRARKFQNADGSFSTNYFRGPGTMADPVERLGSSGHTFEWLATALSDKELREPWVENAANAICLLVFDVQSAPVESGALYHAAHGLVTYYSRVYGNEYFEKQAAQATAQTAAPAQIK